MKKEGRPMQPAQILGGSLSKSEVRSFGYHVLAVNCASLRFKIPLLAHGGAALSVRQIVPEFLLDGPHFVIVGFAHHHLVLQLYQAVETQSPSNDVVDYFFNEIGAVKLAQLVCLSDLDRCERFRGRNGDP
jgi:hypothetical protein